MKPKDLIMQHVRKPISLEQDLDFLGFSLAAVTLSHRRYDAAMAAIAKLHHSQQMHRHGGGLVPACRGRFADGVGAVPDEPPRCGRWPAGP